MKKKKNSFIRPPVSNVDVIVIVASASSPKANPYIIDKFMVVAKEHGVDVLLCINKIDKAESKDIDKIKDIYKIKVDYMRGNFVSSEDINFKEFAEMWLKTVKEHVLSFNSFYHLNAVFKKHLFPILGDLSLRHINKDDIKKLAEYLSLKKLNRTYAAKCIGRVRELLDYAISEELLTSNVVSNTDVSHILASCNNSKKVTA